MDHRAVNEANAINSTQHHVLRSVGGSISLEMQLPKLLWLKKVGITLILVKLIMCFVSVLDYGTVCIISGIHILHTVHDAIFFYKFTENLLV